MLENRAGSPPQAPGPFATSDSMTRQGMRRAACLASVLCWLPGHTPILTSVSVRVKGICVIIGTIFYGPIRLAFLIAASSQNGHVSDSSSQTH